MFYLLNLQDHANDGTPAEWTAEHSPKGNTPMAKTTKTAAKPKTATKRKAPAKAPASKTARAAPAIKPKKAAKATPPATPAPPPATASKRTARQILIEACSRPTGATAKELYAETGWKFASWSHQLRLAAKATGWDHAITKVDGTTRYILAEPKVKAKAA